MLTVTNSTQQRYNV